MRLFAATGLMLLLPVAGVAAADRYHVVTPSFGCVVPWTAWALNDGHNPHHRDPRWLDRVAGRGGCRLVSPIQEWERVGRVDGLALLRQVPPHVGATPLLFPPSNLRKGEIADPALSALAETAVPAPSQTAAQPDVVAATPAASAAPPPAPAAPPDPPVPAASQPPAGAASSSPAASPSVAQGGPAVADAAPSSTPSDPAQHAPAGPAATATAPAAPAAMPGPAAAPPPAAPAAAAADAVHPPALVHARATGALAAVRGLSLRDRVIGLAIPGLLAGLVVLWLLARRRVRDEAGPSPSEPYDAPPGLAAEEADILPIDGNAYRQWCVDSLTEAGWQARMSFPAGRLTADIMARRDGRLLTVQCRPSTRPLEAAVVQEALLVRRAQDAQVAAVVSNAGYTRAARNLAAASGVRLLHETELPEFVS